MAEDIRYSELRFLESLAPTGTSDVFNHHDPKHAENTGLTPNLFIEMVLTAIEELNVQVDDQDMQRLVGKLRGEVTTIHPGNILKSDWENPRETLTNRFLLNKCYRLRLTYRGLRRINELREVLARDRVMEEFGVLLSMQYFRGDLRASLRLSADMPVSVLYADMDKFKPINDTFGHEAGDVVMKAYLETVRDTVGVFGKAYRGRGDEVAVLIKGQPHNFALEIAEKIRKSVSDLRCTYQNQGLPSVSTSIGLATTPPEDRKMDIEGLAEQRNRKAKEQGRNRVIAA